MTLLQEINIRDNKRLVLGLNLASLLLWFPFLYLFAKLIPIVTGSSGIRLNIRAWEPFGLIALIITIFILHEGIHGIFFKLLKPKSKVKFGVIWKSFILYTTCSGFFYSKGKMLVIGTSPFIINSLLLTVVLALGWLSDPIYLFIVSLHAAACSGDFYYVYIMTWKYRNDEILVENNEDGIKIFQS